MVKVTTFSEAIADSASFKKRHLLLGNGFSIACRPKIFSYGSLLGQADFSDAPELADVFKALGTEDFETVIRFLENAAKVIPIYGKFSKTGKRLSKHAALLKDILVGTVAGNHPGIPNEIVDAQFWACRQFLANFLEPSIDGRVYTLNYDLLLYWALMHDDNPFRQKIELNTNDGFGRTEDTEDEFVDWMGETSAHSQRVHYLHGAVHLFDAGTELKKYTWVNTGVPLLTQAREAMDNGMFPLFVAEGSSRQKLTKVKHSAYLYHSYKSFTAQVQQKDQALFIFGHSLAEGDQHVLTKISRGKIAHLYVSLHGDPTSKDNKRIVAAAYKLAADRRRQPRLEVSFFDAASALVWEH